MRNDGLHSARGILRAGLIAIVLLFVAWLCFREAVERALPAGSPAATRVVPRNDDAVLAAAVRALVERRGILDAATLDAVRRATAHAPLDARPYLILGHQQLLDRQPERAVATLEKGQRLDPRQRLIHLLLLDRYLRTGRYTDAAAQFSVLARLVGATQGPIAQGMAEMSMAPETRDAVRRTLAADPKLETSVLTALARSSTDPARIFALASPAARATAGAADSWGPALVTRLVARGRFDEARAVWRQVYRLPEATANVLLYDAALAELPGAAPFNWTLAEGSVGGMDIRNGALMVDYYGRENGELASQLLVLRPGAYRFSFVVDGAKGSAPSGLYWAVQCATGARQELGRVPVQGSGAPRRAQLGFTVPAGCPAQRLVLGGEAGEFPTATSLAVSKLDLAPAPASAR